MDVRDVPVVEGECLQMAPVGEVGGLDLLLRILLLIHLDLLTVSGEDHFGILHLLLRMDRRREDHRVPAEVEREVLGRRCGQSGPVRSFLRT